MVCGYKFNWRNSTTNTSYIYDGQAVILATSSDATIKTSRYLQGPNIDEHLAMVRGADNTYHYYHADGLGSIVAITDKNQKVDEVYTYSAFGVVDSVGNGISNPYRFAGREWDSEAGLYYNRARYYNPKIGRFISKDPIGFASGDTNLYRYVGNNPVNHTDPQGLIIDPVTVAASVLLTTLVVQGVEWVIWAISPPSICPPGQACIQLPPQDEPPIGDTPVDLITAPTPKGLSLIHI